MSKQNALSNENKEVNAKLHNIDMKTDQLNKGNNLLWSKLNIAENASTLPAKNHQKNSENNKSRKRLRSKWLRCLPFFIYKKKTLLHFQVIYLQ